MAPSFKDLSQSSNSSKLMSSIYPNPSQVLHMPLGLLKEYASE